jgi:hypothetical protein
MGRWLDFLPSGRIKFLVLLIGPTYPLRSVQTPNQARTRFFVFVVFLDQLMKYWKTFGYVHFFVDCKTVFEKHWFAQPARQGIFVITAVLYRFLIKLDKQKQ